MKTDKYFMLVALEQAQLGRGLCAPNPSVGAVLVQYNKIIAKAFHMGCGSPHAEQILLQNISANLDQLVLYVTLEPCNHWGKTPPCVDIIIAKGIKRVIFAYYDPNPIVKINNTVAVLQQHNINITYLPLPEIDLFYNSYKYWLLHKKPWVQAKIAQSLDGKIAFNNHQPIQLSNEKCQIFTHTKRLYTDAILTTAATIQIDDPQFNVRLKHLIHPHKKNLAIIDSKLLLTGKEKIFTTAELIHIFHSDKVQPKILYNNCYYHVINELNNLLDLNEIINTLGSLGYHDVWVEVGGKLFSALHKFKLLNKTYIYIVPKILGKNAISAYYTEEIFNRKYIINWQEQAENMIMDIEWLE